MIRVARSKLQNPAGAEDAVQEAFLAAFAHRQTFDPTKSFRGWLWTILLNVCNRQARRERKHHPPADARSTANQDEPVTWQTGLSELLQNERSELLARWLDELSEVEADALRLRFFGGLQFQEIAEAMNCSLNGAKSRVRRGLERLAERVRRSTPVCSDGEDR